MTQRRQPAGASPQRRRTMVGAVRSGGYSPRGSRRGRGRQWLVLLVSVGVLLIAGYLLVPPVFGGLARSLAEENPDLMRIGIFAEAVAEVMDERPDEPAGTDPTPVQFVIDPGTGSREIIADLVERELVTDRLALTYVLVTDGGLDRLRAGTHVLNRTMTPRQVAEALQGAPITPTDEIHIALRQGLRLEQVTAYLLTLDELDFNPADFYELAISPPAGLVAGYPMLATLPAGAGVEGFLGFGIFDIPADTDAEAFLRILLDRRAFELEPLLDRAAPAPLENFYDVITLASIVEREAALDEERPLIAGVFHNRLAGLEEGRRLLNSDSAIIYAKDTMRLRELGLVQWPSYVFWTFDGLPNPQSFEVTPDLAGYHTWHSRGLPPGPIASPSVASIEAALTPDTGDGYLYFLSKLDGSREHVFARTYEEHLQNIEIYLRGGTPSPAATELPTAVPTEASTAGPTTSP